MKDISKKQISHIITVLICLFICFQSVPIYATTSQNSVQVGFWLHQNDYQAFLPYGYYKDLQEYNAHVTSISLNWNSVEPIRGTYNWTAIDKLVNDILTAQPDVKILLHIRSNASWATYPKPAAYPDAEMPVTDMVYWTEFIHEVTIHYKNKISLYTLCNECAVPQNWGGGLYGPTQYAEMLKELYSTAKAVDPEILVTNDGISSGVLLWNYVWHLYQQETTSHTDSVNFMNDALKHHVPSGYSKSIMNEADLINLHNSQAGHLAEDWWTMMINNQQYMDTISLHWYQNADNLLTIMPWIQTQFPNKPLQLWETALGWDQRGILGQTAYSYSFDYQASEIGKLIIIGAVYGNWVQIWPWTSIVEDIGLFPVGIVNRQDNVYRPAAITFKTFANYLNNSTFTSKENLKDNVHIFKFSKNGSNIYAVWSDSPSTISLPYETITQIDLHGESTQITADSIPISTDPVLLLTTTLNPCSHQTNGDFNCDGQININDLITLLNKYGITAENDINGDKKINIIDTVLTLLNLGE